MKLILVLKKFIVFEQRININFPKNHKKLLKYTVDGPLLQIRILKKIYVKSKSGKKVN